VTRHLETYTTAATFNQTLRFMETDTCSTLALYIYTHKHTVRRLAFSAMHYRLHPHRPIYELNISTLS